MKRLILALVFCLACVVALSAQEKPQYQLIPPEKLLVFPPPSASPSVSGIVQGLDLRGRVPASLNLTMKVNPGAVCSVPLLEAHVDAVDPGIVLTPTNKSAPVPQAHVPAPACEKK
jgi:hypothetical protein